MSRESTSHPVCFLGPGRIDRSLLLSISHSLLCGTAEIAIVRAVLFRRWCELDEPETFPPRRRWNDTSDTVSIVPAKTVVAFASIPMERQWTRDYYLEGMKRDY